MSPALAALDRRAGICRVTRETAEAQGRVFGFDHFLRSVFDGVPAPFFVVNERRQVTFANRALLDMVGADEAEVLGRRPGEILDCVHSVEAPGGCGASPACAACDAPAALLAALGGRSATSDCRISLKSGNCLDLRLTTTPIRGDSACALVAAIDISDEKRRRALEHIFFHDVLNTASEVRGLVSIVQEAASGERPELLQTLERTSDRLIDEIQAQRLLASAEVGDLIVHPAPIRSSTLLRDAARTCHTPASAIGTRVGIDPSADDVEFNSDRLLLGRVLANLVKNGLEACGEEERVTVGCCAGHRSVALWVHSPMPMPRAVQLQVFQRSFSTKGPGRGLGTYSARMLTERYLGGSLTFTSTRAEGTRFTARFPLSPGAPA